MTIEEGQALSQDTQPAHLAGSTSFDRAQLCAQYDWLRAVSRSLVRDPWRAEDVAQETLLAALAAPPKESGDVKHMRAWLGRVAFNLSRLGARRAARQQAREARVARNESLPAVTDELELASTARVVESAIAGLPEPHRSVVRLRYFEGLSTAEVAARLGTSELAVRKRLWRARTRLRETLERGAERQPFWAGLLLLRGRVPSVKSLASLAAGVAAGVGGLAWWASTPVSDAARPVELALLAPGARSHEPVEQEASLPVPPRAGAEEAAAQPEARREEPLREPPRPVRLEVLAPPGALFHGAVLDLENRPRAGLEIHASGAPGTFLARTDDGGRFELRSGEPLVLEAGAPGWTTLVPARLARGFEAEPARIVVTPCADLLVHLEDGDGRGVSGARVELVGRATAFAALEFPVRLPSPTLRTAESDADGRASLAALPRGRGLVLRIEAAGYERLECETQELEAEAWLSLRAERPASVLAGRVFHRDGRPAGGARVALAEASALTNERGQYRLPLRGVRPESRLVASDPTETSAPVVLHHFGNRLGDEVEPEDVSPDEPEVRELDLFLGPALERVSGTLLGAAPEGWLVAAFSADGALLEEDGREAPLATATSAATGRFSFALPHGSYDLYALSPSGACALARRGLGLAADWRLEIPAELPLEAALVHLSSDDGRPLANSRVTIHARLDGGEGGRRLRWRELASGADGSLAFARDPALALELVVDHPGARGEFLWNQPGLLAEVHLARPAFLQLQDVPADVCSAALLDRDGQPLPVRDSFGVAADLGFHAGDSPVVEVPPAARWVELRGKALGASRVPIDVTPGERLVVQP